MPTKQVSFSVLNHTDNRYLIFINKQDGFGGIFLRILEKINK